MECADLSALSKRRVAALQKRDLPAPLSDDSADDGAADCAQEEDRYVDLRDNRVGQTEEQSEHQTTGPAGQRQTRRADYNADTKAVEKRSGQGRSFVSELQ